MESKKWLWVVIVCLGVVAVHQIVTLTGGDSAEPPSPEVEPALPQERQTSHTASLGELPTMTPERKQPVIEPAKVEEVPQTHEATTESSEPSPEEPARDVAEVPEAAETREAVEVAEITPVPDPPTPATDQPAVETTPPAPAVADNVKSVNKGVVRGIVYSGQEGSALIDEKIVRAGAVIDGVRVVRIHAGGVEFEKDGRRWTQKVSEEPNPAWQ